MDSREPPQSSPPSRIDSPKKRGRPMKYSPDEQGRPAGSGKKQLDALGVGGTNFTPHVILVNIGEDLAAKITSFCEEGPRLVCILSAHGEVSSATLRPPTGATVVNLEGRYQIISLSGSFDTSEEGGCRMSVSLAGNEGKMVGGSVSGMLVAASKIQIIVSSFIDEGKKKSIPKEKSGPSPEATPSGTQVVNPGASSVTPTSATSQGVSSNSSDENDDSFIEERKKSRSQRRNQGPPQKQRPQELKCFIEERKKKSIPKEKSGPSPAPTPSGTQVVNPGASSVTPTSATSQGVSSNSSDENDDSSSQRGSGSGSGHGTGLYSTVREPDL
ncbi:hypothetical protein K1719_036335 [Acacia pycnantha]|nr:hypothetical protein K1719_036335 [Acacia pycnantha]